MGSSALTEPQCSRARSAERWGVAGKCVLWFLPPSSSDLVKGLVSGRNFPPPVGAEKLEQGRGESKPKGEHVAEGVAYPRGSEGAPLGPRDCWLCAWLGRRTREHHARSGRRTREYHARSGRRTREHQCPVGEEDPGAPVHPRGRFHPLNPPANAHGWELQTSLAHGGHPGGIETEGFLFPPMIPLWP